MKKRSTIQKRKDIALERIQILRGMIKRKPDFEKRYRQLIKRLAKKYRLKIDF
jgi:RNase P subunit RPR2